MFPPVSSQQHLTPPWSPLTRLVSQTQLNLELKTRERETRAERCNVQCNCVVLCPLYWAQTQMHRRTQKIGLQKRKEHHELKVSNVVYKLKNDKSPRL